MELSEVMIQGVVGVPALERIVVQPGLTLLPAGPAQRLVVRLTLDLLFPKGTEPTLADLALAGQQGRAAVVVVGRDQQRYRAMIDVATGRRLLQRMAGDKAEVVTQAAAEIGQVVTATVGFPQEDVLRELFFLAREELPSQRKAKPSSSSSSSSSSPSSGGARADKPLPPGFGGPSSSSSSSSSSSGKPLPPGFDGGGGSGARPVGDEAALRRRLAELDNLLQAQGAVRELEFEIDGLQKKLFEIEAKLGPLQTMRRSVEQARGRLAGLAHLDNVPPNLMERAQLFKRATASHDAEAARFEENRQALLAELGGEGAVHDRPLDEAQRDPLVKWGVAAGVIAVVAGVVGGLALPAMRYLALLDIPAFGVALFGGIRLLSHLEGKERLLRRLALVEGDRDRAEARYRADVEQVQGMLRKAGLTLEQLPDVEVQLRERNELAQSLAGLEHALAEAEQGGGVRELEAQAATVHARVRALEEKLQTAQAGYGSADLEAERADILRALEGGGAPEPAAVVQEAPAPSPASATASGGITLAEDRAARLFSLASDVLLGKIEDVAQEVSGRIGQILAALTDGRYRGVEVGARGATSVVDAASGEALPFGVLPPGDRDLAFLAVKIALIEATAKRGRVPVIFDRSLDVFPDGKAQILVRMLHFLASMTQVVAISEKPAFAGGAH